MAAPEKLPWTGNESADRLLAEDPLALVVGMLLDQQIPMERAFLAPYLLRERLGGHMDATSIAALPFEVLEAAFRAKPALHRFPGSMARRTHDLCAYLVEHFEGNVAAVWKDADSGRDLYLRVVDLPGFGSDKARIFVGVLGKRFGFTPPGWEEQAADWPSIADVADWDQIAELRERKRAMKAARSQRAARAE